MTMTQHTEYPALDKDWAERVVLDLRARGANGATVGDALATADAHCAESGESVWDAFGDPAAYAAQIPLSQLEKQSVDLSNLIRPLVPVVIQLLGMYLVLASVDAFRQHTGTPARLTMVLQALLIVLFTALMARQLAWASRHLVLATVAFGVVDAGVVGLGFLKGPVIATMPVWVGATLGVVMLVSPAVWQETRGSLQPDPVTDPRVAALPVRGWLVKAAIWMVPAFTLVMAGVGLTLR